MYIECHFGLPLENNTQKQTWYKIKENNLLRTLLYKVNEIIKLNKFNLIFFRYCKRGVAEPVFLNIFFLLEEKKKCQKSFKPT